MRPNLPNIQPYAQPVLEAYDRIENMIADCTDTLKAIDRSNRLELPITICRCGAPTRNVRVCPRCERKHKKK